MLTISFAEAWRVYLAAAHRMPAAAPAVTPGRIGGVLEVAADFEVFVLDAYGVMNLGETAIEAARQAFRELRQRGKAVCILTNDAAGDKETIAAGHRGRGFDVAAADIVAGIDLLPAELALHPDFRRFGVVASWTLPFPELLGAMTRLDTDAAAYDAVDGMVFLDSLWTMEKQRILVDSLRRRRRPLIVCNPDVACPYGHELSAEPGYFLHQVAAETGIEATYLGKPHLGVYEAVAARYPGVPRARMLAVGDTPHTDILGARAAGMRALLVESGFCRGQDSAALCRESGVWPDFMAPHL